eukprot:NODE_1104_length_1578_cov_14.459124_g908_i0.p1 GENE.NODE_1104_length_1578_cov_14.459124_g908_i0~~NODE_1104_length_1578_cov_14.459124_g908_i0.p1  ORF type:complete len:506 (-),score=103.39 NODE_1104_length_1578_cov_14.459124_g908_i0:59-1363(-)
MVTQRIIEMEGSVSDSMDDHYTKVESAAKNLAESIATAQCEILGDKVGRIHSSFEAAKITLDNRISQLALKVAASGPGDISGLGDKVSARDRSEFMQQLSTLEDRLAKAERALGPVLAAVGLGSDGGTTGDRLNFLSPAEVEQMLAPLRQGLLGIQEDLKSLYNSTSQSRAELAAVAASARQLEGDTAALRAESRSRQSEPISKGGTSGLDEKEVEALLGLPLLLEIQPADLLQVPRLSAQKKLDVLLGLPVFDSLVACLKDLFHHVAGLESRLPGGGDDHDFCGALGIEVGADDGGTAGGGVQVAGIKEGGPAHIAGLAIGDIIKAFNGQKITGKPALRLAVRRAGAGELVTASVQRPGEYDQRAVQIIPDGTSSSARPPRPPSVAPSQTSRQSSLPRRTPPLRGEVVRPSPDSSRLAPRFGSIVAPRGSSRR